MKKVITVLLVLLLLCALCACGVSETGNVTDDTNNAKIEDTGKKAPSEELITNDLIAALQSKNEYASLTGVETVKSLTNDGAYQITLSVTAETKYADWQHVAMMSYSLYDQGWIVDNVEWIDSSYEIVRLPDVGAMSEYASSYLLSHTVYSDVWFTDFMIPMIDPSLTFDFNSETNSEVLQLGWTSIEDNDFYNSTYSFTTLWQYDCNLDDWELTPNNEQGSLGYHVSLIPMKNIPKQELNLNGQWGNEYIQFIFSNFTWEGFDVHIPGHIESSKHFTFTVDTESNSILPPQKILNTMCDIAFKNEEGNFITFNFSSNSLEIYYFDGSYTYNGYPWSNVWYPIDGDLL